MLRCDIDVMFWNLCERGRKLFMKPGYLYPLVLYRCQILFVAVREKLKVKRYEHEDKEPS